MTELTRERIESIEREMDERGVRHVYDEMILDGQHPNMAAMLACRQGPATWNTDSDFIRKENQRMQSIDPKEMIKIQSIAKRHGIDTTGKTYAGSLGKYSDPLAWVSDTHDVAAAAKAKQMDIDGVVKVNAYRGPKPKTRIAPDILNDLEKRARKADKLLDERCKKNPKSRVELRKQLTERHTKPK